MSLGSSHVAVQPFSVSVPDAVLTDLSQRLSETRWPDEVPGSGWRYGTELAYLRELVEYWRESFDWRAAERRLNAFTHVTAEVDGFGLHCIHQRGKGPSPIPLLLIHGWPSTFFEMHKIIGPLSDPAAHGGDPADAFDIVVPSLPGYGFSEVTREPGVNVARIADLFAGLATALGYDRFACHGGDWGGAVTNRLGLAYRDRVIGIHVTRALARGSGKPKGPPSEEQRLKRERLERFQREEYGYSAIQGTKPQTLAYGLNDSPAGLAAWIVEKFRRWTDCGGDVERVYSKDELLTNITLYWVTQTINASARLYYEDRRHPTVVPKGERIEVPMGGAFFPKDFAPPPRAGAERVYADIRRWTVFDWGGHFPALERPDVLVGELREFFRPLRRT